MSATLNELKSIHYHKKILEIENIKLRDALREIKREYVPNTRAHKIAKKALEK